LNSVTVGTAAYDIEIIGVEQGDIRAVYSFGDVVDGN